MSEMTFRFAGDQALLVEFENEISIPVNQKVRSLKVALEREKLDGQEFAKIMGIEPPPDPMAPDKKPEALDSNDSEKPDHPEAFAPA